MRDLALVIGSVLLGYLAAVAPIHWRLNRLDTELSRVTAVEHKRTVELSRELEDRLAALEESRDGHGERIGDLDYRLSDLLKQVTDLCRRLDRLGHPLGAPGAAPEPQPAPPEPGPAAPIPREAPQALWAPGHRVYGPVVIQERRISQADLERELAALRLQMLRLSQRRSGP